MKKIIILLLASLFLFTSCTSVSNGEQIEPDTTIANETVSLYGETPSYEQVSKDIDTFFRMYYVKNQNYLQTHTKNIEERNAIVIDAAGFFDGDALVKMEVKTKGESPNWTTTYYFINENLTYITCKATMLYLQPFQEKLEEYYLIDGVFWQYNNKTNSLEISEIGTGNSPIASKDVCCFEQDKQAVLNGKPLIFAENTFALPKNSNSFTAFNTAKNEHFRKLFSSDIYELKTLNDNAQNSSEKIYYTLSDDSELCKIDVISRDEISVTEYTYYVIEQNNVYAEVRYQEFENDTACYESDYSKLKKDCCNEYYIVDDKLMIYDSEKLDLTESTEKNDILEYYNNAKTHWIS